MKVLIVCSGNAGYISPFVLEQVDAIAELGIDVKISPVIGKGVLGYLKNLPVLKKKINEFKPDIIHAHYGLSGLLACLQRIVPVLITFHGSDTYIPNVRLFSKIAARLSKYNIFVSEKIKHKINGNKRHTVVPCGINLDIFYPVEMELAREKLNLDCDKRLILFASGFDNPVKNSALAFAAVKLLNEPVEIIELKNKSREQVNLLLNACNLLLLTSFSEGSPQVIKEAMASNCPIVATDVGDISELISGTAGCFITSFEPVDVADKIEQTIKFGNRTSGREKIKHFDNKIIAEKVFDIYKMVSGDKLLQNSGPRLRSK